MNGRTDKSNAYCPFPTGAGHNNFQATQLLSHNTVSAGVKLTVSVSTDTVACTTRRSEVAGGRAFQVERTFW